MDTTPKKSFGGFGLRPWTRDVEEVEQDVMGALGEEENARLAVVKFREYFQKM
jgi:hypothetical protein